MFKEFLVWGGRAAVIGLAVGLFALYLIWPRTTEGKVALLVTFMVAAVAISEFIKIIVEITKVVRHSAARRRSNRNEGSDE